MRLEDLDLVAEQDSSQNQNMSEISLSSIMPPASTPIEQDDILVPSLHPFIAGEAEMLARIRTPSFQAGLMLMLEGSRHLLDCPAAGSGQYNNSRECTCLKRSSRPGRRRLTTMVSESDLMKYPLKQFNAFVQDSGLADAQYVEYTRFLREMWHRPIFSKDRLPENSCELGCGRLKEFRLILQHCSLTYNGARFLEEERERFMNRLQQHNSRQRRKERTKGGNSPNSGAGPSQGRSRTTSPQQSPHSGAERAGVDSHAFGPQHGNFPSFVLPSAFAQDGRGSRHIPYPFAWASAGPTTSLASAQAASQPYQQIYPQPSPGQGPQFGPAVSMPYLYGGLATQQGPMGPEAQEKVFQSPNVNAVGSSAGGDSQEQDLSPTSQAADHRSPSSVLASQQHPLFQYHQYQSNPAVPQVQGPALPQQPPHNQIHYQTQPHLAPGQTKAQPHSQLRPQYVGLAPQGAGQQGQFSSRQQPLGYPFQPHGNFVYSGGSGPALDSQSPSRQLHPDQSASAAVQHDSSQGGYSSPYPATAEQQQQHSPQPRRMHAAGPAHSAQGSPVYNFGPMGLFSSSSGATERNAVHAAALAALASKHHHQPHASELDAARNLSMISSNVWLMQRQGAAASTDSGNEVATGGQPSSPSNGAGAAEESGDGSLDSGSDAEAEGSD